MKLESIKIEHFRGILKLELPIDDPLTVIVGNNGIGKTSILDAIAYCLVGLRGLWTTRVAPASQRKGIFKVKCSNKGAAPKIFIDWVNGEQKTREHLPPYSDLQNPEKEAMRQSLMKEQGYLCVYCGRSLASDFSDSHIDHFWPQSIFNGKTHENGKIYKDRRVCYSNLFMSCGRDSGLPITCGRAKETV